MFEQEAVDRVIQQFGTAGELITRTRIWEDGAEFGYDKGYHDAEEHYLNVIDSQHKLVDESKREKFKKCADSTYQYSFKDFYKKDKELIEALSKSLFLAKGIVRDLIDDTVDPIESKGRAIECFKQKSFDIYKEAEQFLKEIKASNNGWHSVYDELPKENKKYWVLTSDGEPKVDSWLSVSWVNYYNIIAWKEIVLPKDYEN